MVDHAQGLGLGSLLLRHLWNAAIERGIEYFECDVLEQNGPVRHLLEACGPTVGFQETEPGVLSVTIALPDKPLDEPHPSPFAALRRLLGHAANDGFTLLPGRPHGRRLKGGGA